MNVSSSDAVTGADAGTAISLRSSRYAVVKAIIVPPDVTGTVAPPALDVAVVDPSGIAYGSPV